MSKVLSPRQWEAIRLVMEGKSNWEISQIMEISTSTVKNHLKTSYQKLGVANRIAAVATIMRQQRNSQTFL